MANPSPRSLGEHCVHGLVGDRLVSVSLARPAGVEYDASSRSAQRNGTVQRGVRAQEVQVAGGICIGADWILEQVLMNLWILLVPVRVRNALQHATYLWARCLYDPDDCIAEVPPVPAVRVTGLVLADYDILFPLPGAGQQFRVSDLAERVLEAGRIIYGGDKL